MSALTLPSVPWHRFASKFARSFNRALSDVMLHASSLR